MIKVENATVFNIEGALRGMRNPMNSWNKSDSYYDEDGNYVLGEKDLELCKKLIKAGTEHRKFLRQIFISMDITAPLYWWKEMDQYRINVTTNSCSTMHKISAKEFELDDFSHEHLDSFSTVTLMAVIATMNNAREKYLSSKDKKDWWQLIQLLPSSYNQKRTITMNYENLFNIINQRSNHKLDEWVNLCKFLRDFPYVNLFLQ